MSRPVRTHPQVPTIIISCVPWHDKPICIHTRYFTHLITSAHGQLHINCPARLCCCQVLYVEHCLAAERLKAAARAVRSFGLQEEFPDVEKVSDE